MTIEFHKGRRRLLSLLPAAAIAHLSSARSQAKTDWPTRPITLLTGFAAGGTTDNIARTVGKELGNRLGQPIVVDSRAGAGGTIAMTAVQRAEPDGYTLILMPNPTVNFFHFLKKNVDYAKDFTPVGEVYTQYNVLLVNPAVPEFADVRTVQQVIALAKQKNGTLNYTSTGIGSLGHLTMERVCAVTGVSMQHIGYKGAAPAMNDMLAGQVGLMYADSLTALPHIRSGKLRAVAVSTAERQPDLPDVPTMAEQGLPELSGGPYAGILAPPRTPKAIVDRISEQLKIVLEMPEIKEKLHTVGTTASYMPPEQFGAFLNRESQVVGRVIVERNIKPQ